MSVKKKKNVRTFLKNENDSFETESEPVQIWKKTGLHIRLARNHVFSQTDQTYNIIRI